MDLRQSLTLTRPRLQRADFDYITHPTLRIHAARPTGTIVHGLVTDQRSERVNPATPDACRAYVYAGDPASVVPDNIRPVPDTGVCPPAERPLLETPCSTMPVTATISSTPA